MVLVGGTPGVGKSTLMMQLAAMLARGTGDGPGMSVAYVSGEESSQQLKQRAARLGVSAEDVSVLNETDLGSIIAQLQPDASGQLPYQVAVIDSVQTMCVRVGTACVSGPAELTGGAGRRGCHRVCVCACRYLDDVASMAGSVGQVKACAMQLLHVAKSTGLTVFLVGHVTKSGDLAGPRVLEHLGTPTCWRPRAEPPVVPHACPSRAGTACVFPVAVDTVLYVEGSSSYGHRLVRTAKNRFGSTSEVRRCRRW